MVVNDSNNTFYVCNKITSGVRNVFKEGIMEKAIKVELKTIITQAKESAAEQLNVAKSYVHWYVRTIERLFVPIIPYIVWMLYNVENIKNFHVPNAYHGMAKFAGMMLVNKELFLTLFVAAYFATLAKKILRER